MFGITVQGCVLLFRGLGLRGVRAFRDLLSFWA